MGHLGGEQVASVLDAEDSDVPREKLAAFREKVERAKHVKYWTSPEDLAGKVALTWNTFRRRYPATGWIKANQGTSKESLAALARAQKEIEDLQGQLLRVRTQAPPGTEKLAQGESKFSLPVYVHGRWQTRGGEYMTPAKVNRWTAVEMTWNRTFGYLGLRMMQEADEPTLLEDLRTVVQQEHNNFLKSQVHSLAKKASEGARHVVWFDGIIISDEDFQTILLQFNALGLIQHSARNRSVKDTSNYWALTPYGQTRLVQLRAVQSGDVELLRVELPEPALEDKAPSVAIGEGAGADHPED